MSENRTQDGKARGPSGEDGAKSAETEGAGPLSSDSLVYESWLRVYLSKLHLEVLGEPLPREMNEIIERFRTSGRAAGPDRRRTTVASQPLTPLP